MSLTYHQHLVDAGIVESTGSVGDSYDNALAENVNGSYKNEIIHTRRWADVLDVEIATFEGVNWWNTERLHQALDHRTRGRDRLLATTPAVSDNNKQGKRPGSKPGPFHPRPPQPDKRASIKPGA